MLRRSPRLTPAALAARRANALKSTGPRTERGKARAALNPLQHGRYAANLPERLARAGDSAGEAEWRKIRARITQVFEPTFGLSGTGLDQTGPRLEKRMDQLANWVWYSHRNWREQWGAELGSPSVSKANRTRVSYAVPNPSERSANWIPPQIRIHNPWVRLGLVFYAQRRRGWMLQQLTDLIVAWQTGSTATPRCVVKDPRGTGTTRNGCATGLLALDLASEMETGLRSHVYPLGRPRFWEQMRYCLDREGNYHPELRGRFRQCRRELRNAGLGWILEPHPILTMLRQEAAQSEGAFGLSGGSG